MFRNGDDGYGGYEGGGGGFDVSGFGGTGETPQGDKKVRRSDSIVPVTVRQILESKDSGLKIGQIDVEAQMVKLIGIVKKINRSNIKVIYTIEDNTGAIEGVQWLESENDDNFTVPVVENTYCTMVGSIRNVSTQHSERHIMVFQIFPVEDLNQVTAHCLQIIHMSLKSDMLNQTISAPMETTSMPQGMMNNSSIENNDLFKTLTPVQQRVLRALSQSCDSGEGGTHIDTIMEAMTVKIPKKELEKILEYLCSEGHAYSTTDEFHFKCT
ncbi:replication protein A 32 kDa subunit-like [Macrosteles quadrilineatus]|uniref:replication protein A 32 kDa subunit-like n=1 Tax=Macrosteles quadrilineatus TaxID=74068 RepID=UPI0023E234AC|nr:replication protein A 32 kDa subunit-like [Macrosteles quadrilineatus]XP_054289178.1 replication protein A 32 kDa subunit-like [Macrosteles quadrilineatus]